MVQSPTKGSSLLCSGPGVPAFARTFSKSAGLGGALLSCAAVQLASTARPNTSAAVTPIAIRNLFITFSFLRPLDDEPHPSRRLAGYGRGRKPARHFLRVRFLLGRSDSLANQPFPAPFLSNFSVGVGLQGCEQSSDSTGARSPCK